MQHNFFYAESLVHSYHNYKNIIYKLFGRFQKSLSVWAGAEKRIFNAGWPPAAGSKGSAPAFDDFYNFLMK